MELSVIIPTHNRRDFLFYEISHIYMQRKVDFEIIVLNDIEELDATDEITSIFPNVVYIKDSSIQGPSNKHKAGYAIAKGAYLYMPDDDDYLTDPMFFRKAIDCLEKNRNLSFVSGQCEISYEYEDTSQNSIELHQTNVHGFVKRAEYLQEFQHRMDKPLSTVSTVFRKQAFDETNAINMIEMSDSSMYMQALLWGDAYILNDYVAVYRIKDGSLTSTLKYDFMMNVLRQKELLYEKSKNLLVNPRDFWFQQYALSYRFFPNKTKKVRRDLTSWGIRHNNGSKKMLILCLYEKIKSYIL